MKNRTLVLGAVFVAIGLPLPLVVREAIAFHAANTSSGSMIVAGHKREYVLYVPPTYDRAKPAPLVISMHGAGGWGNQQMRLSGWNTVADAKGFIVVYPAGRDGAGPRVWHVDRGAGLDREVEFISALIDTLSGQYNIDASRIYANGMSNGGGMSFVLSCRLSNRIAAVGLVASAQTLPWSWCTDHSPVPMMSIHGSADPLIPYTGGKSWLAPNAFPSMISWTRAWARRNKCAENPSDSEVAVGVSRRAYSNCANGADVVLLTVQGGGHTWPGGEEMPEWFVGPTNRTIDASRELWEFFRAHPLAPR